MIWRYSSGKGWMPAYKLDGIPHPSEKLDDETVGEYAERIGYGKIPIMASCNDHVMIAVWLGGDEKYLVQFELDGLKQLVFAESFPSVLELLHVMQPMIACFQFMESKCS